MEPLYAARVLDLETGNLVGMISIGLGDPVVPPPLLLQSVVSVTNGDGNADAGTLRVYVTSTDNTDPAGVSGFTLDFSTTNLTPGWSETMATYLDPGNGVFALTTPLERHLPVPPFF